MVTCPEGKQSIAWKEYTKPGSRQRVRALFYKWDCLPCSARKRCTQDVRRSLSFLPKAQYKALEKTRQVHRSKRGQERYKRRAGIEGALSQGVRGFGLRRSRYRGLAKTHLQNVAIGAAINLDRLVNYLNGVPLAKTRVSHFRALKVA